MGKHGATVFFGTALCVAACATMNLVPVYTSVEAVLRNSRAVGETLDADARAALAAEGRGPASKLKPRFQQPLRKIQVNSRFGKRDGSFHAGIDYQAAEGTPIYAAEKGIVVFAGDNIWGYGDTVIIRHIGGFASLYAHASVLGVEVGQTVEKGQFIAYAGETGNASGPHLHFEIREGAKAVNPVPWLFPPRQTTSVNR